MKMTSFMLRGTMVGALGGLLFGFDTAVIAGTQQQLTDLFHLTPTTFGFTVSIGLIGTVIGAIFAGPLGQKIGSREALRIMAVLYAVAAIGSAFAWNWEALLAFRVIGGLGIGGSSVLGPVYIAELAPAQWRGRMVGVFQINIVIGILVAYLSNYLIAGMHLGAAEWRWEFGVAAIPSLAFLGLLFAIPRSSRWLVTTGQHDEALEVLRQMGSPNSEAELLEIQDSLRMDAGAANESLFQGKYRWPIFLAITIGMFNQLSGINAILYYGPQIFTYAGYDKSQGLFQTMLVGLSNLLATFIGMALIDKLGRKTLLLIGAIGMALCMAGVAGVFFTDSHKNLLVWCLVAFIAFFAVSQGAVIWVYLAEVFPSRVRSKGQSLGSTSHWVMNATIAQIFPLVAARSGGFPFAFFAAMMLVQFFVVLFVYPETKGATLEQLQQKLSAA